LTFVLGCGLGIKGLSTASRRQAALDAKPASKAWRPSDQDQVWPLR
jgi:hypothetical protein